MLPLFYNLPPPPFLLPRQVISSAGVYMSELLDSIAKKSPLEVKFDLFNPSESPNYGTLSPTGTVKLILSYEKREVAAGAPQPPPPQQSYAPLPPPPPFAAPPPQYAPVYSPYGRQPVRSGPRFFPLFLAAATAGAIVYFTDKNKKKSRY